MNTVILRTPTGLLKILEIVRHISGNNVEVVHLRFILTPQVLVLICLLMCRFGGRDSYPLSIGDNNDNFLAYGTLVGFAIIVPAILFTYLLGANLTILVRDLGSD